MSLLFTHTPAHYSVFPCSPFPPLPGCIVSARAAYVSPPSARRGALSLRPRRPSTEGKTVSPETVWNGLSLIRTGAVGCRQDRERQHVPSAGARGGGDHSGERHRASVPHVWLHSVRLRHRRARLQVGAAGAPCVSHRPARNLNGPRTLCGAAEVEPVPRDSWTSA